jgi:hypothetical protein
MAVAIGITVFLGLIYSAGYRAGKRSIQRKFHKWFNGKGQ